MGPRDTTSGERSKNRVTINSLLENRHARKDMLNGLFQGHFTTPATIRCRLDDHVVHLNPHDSTITPAILEKGHWNRHELDRGVAILQAHGAFRDDSVFLDVGANIGTQTIYAMKSSGRSGPLFRAVHAFEPEPENARLFSMNVDENDLGRAVTLFHSAVGAEDGTTSLFRHPRNTGAHSVVDVQRTGEGTSIDVPITTLDAHLARAGTAADLIGLVWIDVEGAEPGVIAGAATLIEARVPMVFEFLDRDRARPEFAEMFSTLRAAYKNICCLQDEAMTVANISTLTTALPEGDYMVFSSLEPGHV